MSRPQLLFCVALSLVLVPLLGLPHPAFGQSGPPVILDTAGVVITAPTTGSTVTVAVPSEAIGNAGPQTGLTVKNERTGVVSAGVPYMPQGWTVITLKAAAGDVLTLKAETVGEGSAEEELDYVPESSADAAEPNFVSTLISSSFSGGTFTVMGGTGAIEDNSFPVEVSIKIEDDTAWSTPVSVDGDGVASTEGFSVPITASNGDIAVVRITDDYGNYQDRLFVVGGGSSSVVDGFFPQGYPSSSQAGTETTGMSPTAGVGIQVAGREFVHGFTLYSRRGPTISTVVSFAYRTGGSYDGVCGRNWDTNLNDRIHSDNTDPSSDRWLYTERLRIGPFSFDASQSSGSEFVYSSPPGFFSRLTFDSSQMEYYVEDAHGNRSVYDFSTGLLSRWETPFAGAGGLNSGTVELVRNNESQVVRIKAEDGAVLRLQWYSSGHLGSIVDGGVRKALVEYDSSRRLVAVAEAGMDWRTNADLFSYAGTSSRIEGLYDQLSRQFLKNVYDVAGLVEEQRTWHNRDWDGGPTTNSIRFAVVDPSPYPADNVVEVLDAADCRTLIGFGSGPNYPLVFVRKYSGIRATSAYPGSSAPSWWETQFEVNSSNLLLGRTYHQTSDQPGIALEAERWAYAHPLSSSDPRAASVVTSHVLEGPEDFTETWIHPAAGPLAYFPTSYTDFEGNATSYVWLLGGQLKEERVTSVSSHTSSGPVAYDVATQYDYNTDGTLQAVWGPDRVHAKESDPSGTYHPSLEYSYHNLGTQSGYLAEESVLHANGVTATSQSFEWDQGLKAREIDESGGQWDYSFDERGRLIQMLEPEVDTGGVLLRGEKSYSYEGPNGEGANLAEVKVRARDELGADIGSGWVASSYEYDPLGNVTREELDYRLDGLGGVERVVRQSLFDERGLLVEVRSSMLDGKTALTRNEYDSRGLLMSVSRNPSYEEDAQGTDLVEWYGYDHAGRLVEQFRPGASDAYEQTYDAYGRLSLVESPDARLDDSTNLGAISGKLRTAYTRNRNGLVTQSVRDAFLGSNGTQYITGTVYEYDTLSRPHRTKRPIVKDADPAQSSDWVTYTHGYSPSGATTYLELPDGLYSEVTLDDLGRPSEGVDAAGDEYEIRYDPFGRISDTVNRPFNDAAETVLNAYRVAYEYDELGRMVRHVSHGDENAAPGQISGEEYTYDSLSRLIQRRVYTEDQGVKSFGIRKRFTYDLAGNVIKVKKYKSGGTYEEYSEFDHDLQGRVIEHRRFDYPATSFRKKEFEFDALGRLVKLTQPSRTTLGVADRITSRTYVPGAEALQQVVDPLGVVREYEYNEIGQVIGIDVDKSGGPAHITGPDRIEYSYVSRLDFSVALDPVEGRVLEGDSASGYTLEVETVRKYNARGELMSDKVEPSGYPAMETTYERNDRGQIESMQYPGPNGPIVDRAYRGDDVVSEIAFRESPTSTPTKLMEIKSNGPRAEVTTVWDTTSCPVLTATNVFDRLGRMSGKDVTTDPGQQVIQDQLYSRTDSGHIETVSSAEDPDRYDHFFLDDANRAVKLVEESTSSDPLQAESGSDYLSHEIELNDFGEMTHRTLDGPQVPNPTAVEWDYNRDEAGFLVVEGEFTVGDQLVSWGDATTPVTWKRDHTLTYDNMGNLVEEEFALDTNDPSLYIHVEQTNLDYEYNAWGQQVLQIEDRSQLEDTRNGVSAPPWDLLTTVETSYDAFGRAAVRVQETDHPGQENAAVVYGYDGHERIAAEAYDLLGNALATKRVIPGPTGVRKVTHVDSSGDEIWFTEVSDFLARKTVSNRPPMMVTGGCTEEVTDICKWDDSGNSANCILKTLYWDDGQVTRWIDVWGWEPGCPAWPWTYDEFGSLVGWAASPCPPEFGSAMGMGHFLAEFGDGEEKDEEELEEILTEFLNSLSEEARAQIVNQLKGMSGRDQDAFIEALVAFEVMYGGEDKHGIRQLPMVLLEAYLEQGNGLKVKWWGAPAALNWKWSPSGVERNTLYIENNANPFAAAQGIAESLYTGWGDWVRGAAWGQYAVSKVNAELGPLAAKEAIWNGYVAPGLESLSEITKTALEGYMIALDLVTAGGASIGEMGFHLSAGDPASMALAAFSRLGARTGRISSDVVDDLAVTGRGGEPWGICFAAGTVVTTESGLIPIEEIQVGDAVLAQNVETGELSWQPVLQCFETKSSSVVAVEFHDDQLGSETIFSTPAHPFFVQWSGWVPASELEESQAVVRVEGEPARVAKVSAPLPARAVYNIEVADYHTYFVGELRVLVHNASRIRGQKKEVARRSGKVTLEFGAKLSSSEKSVANALTEAGYDVRGLATASSRGISGEQTADLFVDGMGMVDVYSPVKLDSTTISRGIEKKVGQTSIVVLTGVESDMLRRSSVKRTWKKPGAAGIKSIGFLSNGKIEWFSR